MTAGLQADTANPRYYTIRLLDTNVGTSAVPTEQAAATALAAVPTAAQFYDLAPLGLPSAVFSADWEIYVHNVAGTDAVACTVRLWAYNRTTALIYPWGVGTGALKGIINDGASIDTSITDKVRHWERIEGPGMCDGIMAQSTASAGTGSESFTVDVRCPKNVAGI